MGVRRGRLANRPRKRRVYETLDEAWFGLCRQLEKKHNATPAITKMPKQNANIPNEVADRGKVTRTLGAARPRALMLRSF